MVLNFIITTGKILPHWDHALIASILQQQTLEQELQKLEDCNSSKVQIKLGINIHSIQFIWILMELLQIKELILGLHSIIHI